MLNVVCVLKSGGDFTEEHVRRLHRGVSEHLTQEHFFFCLTDLRCEAVPWCTIHPLQDALPGWWSKMEVFKLKGQVLYFDLDTIIKGDLDKFSELDSQYFYMLRGFYRPESLASGVMYWNGDYSYIYSEFLRMYEGAEIVPKGKHGPRSSEGLRYLGKVYRGDQDFLQDVFSGKSFVKGLQDVISGIYSYKVDCTPKSIPADSRVICFHGKPRPHEITTGPLKW